MSTERISVLIADDHRLFREALRVVLERECDVVGEAASGEEAMALAARTRPNIVLLDVGMPGVGGLNAAHRLAKEAPFSKVVILSQHDDEEYVIEAMVDAGAAGYLVKTDAAAELLSALRAVAAGRRYLSTAVAPAVLARLKNTRGAGAAASAAVGKTHAAGARGAEPYRRGRDQQGYRRAPRYQPQDRAGSSRQPQAEDQGEIDGRDGALRDQA